jgi:filamentous hemagglutinin
MSYIGLNPQTQLLNTSSQNFSGNGVATQFTLSRNVASASDLDVIIGTTAQRPFIDYTAGNVELLFTSAPGAGSNNITVTYRAGALNSLNLTATAFPAGTVGAPGVYSLAANNSGIYWANATSVSVSVAGTERATFNSTAASTSNVTGALTVSGGIGATGNLNTSGLVRFTNTTDSTSISSGALIASGGVGIQGNLNVGQNITCVGDFTVNGTFTTTGTDSLDVTDPFIFLANANPGDTYDTGVVAEYYDGTNTRYTGYFRDITDNRYKLFANLLTRPTSTVDTTDPSFAFAPFVAANISATGNVSGTYLLGNAAFVTGISVSTPNAIVNTNSTMIIPASNGNIIGNVNSNTITTIAATGLFVTGLISATGNVIATGNVNSGNVTTGGLISATGNVTSAANVSGANVISGAEVIASTNVSAIANVIGGNVTTAGVVSATGNVISGNLNAAGLSLSSNVVSALNSTSNITTTANISGGNVISTLVGSVAFGAGTINGTGNITGGNIIFGSGNVTGTGNVIAGNIVFGSGQITGTGNINTANVSIVGGAGTISVLGNITGGNIMGGANVNATTHTGTTVDVTGNITGGNLNAAGLSLSSNVVSALNSTSGITTTANITGGNIVTGGEVSALTNISAAGNVIAGNVTTGGLVTATGNVTGGNILTSGIVSAAGNITSLGNVAAGFVVATTGVTAGSSGVSATGNITGGNLLTSGVTSSAGNITSSANISGGNLLGAGLSLSSNVISVLNTTSNITTTANITGGNVQFGAGIVSGTGNILGGNLNIGTGSATLGSIINANANGIGNIGSASLYFNTVFAKATSAQYADLAEWYEADADYEPGTVLVFGGDQEVTIAVGINDVRVAGVVSTNPAHIMNSGLKAPHVAAVALTGRVPTLVVGEIKKGDMMVTAGGGRAQACAEPRIGSVIGKALQDHPGGQGTIEIVVGRM